MNYLNEIDELLDNESYSNEDNMNSFDIFDIEEEEEDTAHISFLRSE